MNLVDYNTHDVEKNVGYRSMQQRMYSPNYLVLVIYKNGFHIGLVTLGRKFGMSSHVYFLLPSLTRSAKQALKRELS